MRPRLSSAERVRAITAALRRSRSALLAHLPLVIALPDAQFTAGFRFAVAKVESTFSREEAYEGILATARDRQCDLIAMASHGRKGARAVLLGSQTQQVLTHSAIPVLVLR
jgi:nucleotide-binding universal stress UspA family protein